MKARLRKALDALTDTFWVVPAGMTLARRSAIWFRVFANGAVIDDGRPGLVVPSAAYDGLALRRQPAPRQASSQ